MKSNPNTQQEDAMGARALIDSAQNLAIQATHLLEVAVDLSNTGVDPSLNSVIRAAREYVGRVADLIERAEVMTLRDNAAQQPQQAGGTA